MLIIGSDLNHNQTLVRLNVHLNLGREINHNQTVVRPATQSAPLPGLAFNHNQTLVRR